MTDPTYCCSIDPRTAISLALQGAEQPTCPQHDAGTTVGAIALNDDAALASIVLGTLTQTENI